MRAKGTNGMGRFSVEFLITNNNDRVLAERGLLPEDQVRKRTVSGQVDCGAAKLVLPEKLVRELGLTSAGKILVRYGDGLQTTRKQADGAYVEILGRHGTFSAIVEPKRDTALIGAIVLEDFDLMPDCNNQRLVPRNPSGPLFEIE